jgi:hypothetical protein
LSAFARRHPRRRASSPDERPQNQKRDPIDLPSIEPPPKKTSAGEPIIVTLLLLAGAAGVSFLIFDLRFGDIGDMWLLLPLGGALFYAVWWVMNR